MIIEILDSQTVHPDMGRKNIPIRVIRFRVQNTVQEYTAQGSTLDELHASVKAAIQPMKAYPMMEIK